MLSWIPDRSERQKTLARQGAPGAGQVFPPKHFLPPLLKQAGKCNMSEALFEQYRVNQKVQHHSSTSFAFVHHHLLPANQQVQV